MRRPSPRARARARARVLRFGRARARVAGACAHWHLVGRREILRFHLCEPRLEVKLRLVKATDDLFLFLVERVRSGVAGSVDAVVLVDELGGPGEELLV